MWIKTVNGYVKAKAIIDVHTSSFYPKTVYIILKDGTSVPYKTCDSEEEAIAEVEKLVNQLEDLSIKEQATSGELGLTANQNVPVWVQASNACYSAIVIQLELKGEK